MSGENYLKCRRSFPPGPEPAHQCREVAELGHRPARQLASSTTVEHVGDVEQLAAVWRRRGLDALLAELPFERANAMSLRAELRLEIEEGLAWGDRWLGSIPCRLSRNRWSAEKIEQSADHRP
jgi:hypothetical protein